MPPERRQSVDFGEMAAGEVIFEFQFMAHAVKVSAIDADSGTEVSIMGPRSASQSELERTARAKLDWVMQKHRGPAGPAGI